MKVPLEPSIEVLAVYQHAWRSDASNAAKEALLASSILCPTPSIPPLMRISDTHCATFRNCSTKAFTQIDFILTRRTQADDQSRCAQPVRTFPLLPTDGMFHFPVCCTVPRTRTPRTNASLPRVRPDVATLMLQQRPAQGQAFLDLVQTRLQHAHSPACVNDILLSSWHMIFGPASRSTAPTPGPCLSQLCYHQRLASEASTVFARWRHAVQYRAVRKRPEDPLIGYVHP